MTGALPLIDQDVDTRAEPGLDPLDAARAAVLERGSPFAPVGREEIAGVDDVVARVDQLAHWLSHARLYAGHGARAEPGVLFEGPPGTGKTLLARYLATEAAAVFVDVAGYPRRGPLTGGDVASLFLRARAAYERHERPVLLFWDELDVHAHRRLHGEPGDADVLAALLAGLDGVRGKAGGVLLVACSNHAELLDPALLRPGRIGVRVAFRAPDEAGRRLLLAHELATLPLAGAVDVDALTGFLEDGDTASAIEEAVAEAWRLAVGRALHGGAEPALAESDLREVLVDRHAGPPPPFGRAVPGDALRIAVHEAGHALAALAFGVPLRLVSVRAGRVGLGRTVTDPGEGEAGSIEELLGLLRVGLGGIEAERTAGLPRSLGTASDTHRVTELALRLVELHAVGRHTGAFNPDATLRRRGARTPELSERLLARADADAARLVARARRDVRGVLGRVGRGRMRTLAAFLARRETLTGAEFERHARLVLGDPARYRRLWWRP